MQGDFMTFREAIKTIALVATLMVSSVILLSLLV